jgi:hypothetical protein
MTTDSQSSLIQGWVSVALQGVRADAVSMADMICSCASADGGR